MNLKQVEGCEVKIIIMISLNKLVLLAGMVQILGSQISPDHCYDFVSTSVTDQCGGGVDFT